MAKETENLPLKLQVAQHQKAMLKAVGGISAGNAVAVLLALENMIIQAEKVAATLVQKSEAPTEDAPKPTKKKPKSPPKQKYGCHGWIELTAEQYDDLVTYMGRIKAGNTLEYMGAQEQENTVERLGKAEVERCIAYVDELCQMNNNKYKWKDWYAVLQKACRQQWGFTEREIAAEAIKEKERQKQGPPSGDLSRMIWDSFMDD